MPVSTVHGARLLACVVTVMLLTAADASAQFGGGGRRGGGFGGGFGGFGGRPSVLRELGYDVVIQELQLTDDQQAQVRELADAPPENMEGMGELFQAMRNAQSDEERAAVSDAIRQLNEQREQQVEEQLKGILNAQQAARLEQIVLHRNGPGALTRPDRAEKLELTEDQHDRLVDLSAERQSAMREMRGATSEERTAAEQEWNEQMLDVLTDGQRARWTAWIGPAPPEIPEEERGFGRGFGRRRGGDRGGPRPETADVPAADPAPVASPAVAAAAAPSGPTVASFDAAGGAAEGKLSFNFQAAPWAEVLRDFARRAGLTLEMKDTPPGTFTYYDKNAYTPKEALDVLNGPLLRLGYVLVQKNEFLICANIDKGPAPHLIPYITSAQLADHGDNELLTVVFSVKGVADITTLAEQVQEMLGPQAKAVGVAAAGALVVTDLGSNLRRVNDLLSAMSALLGPEDIKFQGYPLRHISASEAESLLRSVLGLKVTVKNVSGGGRSDRSSRDRFRGGWPGFGRGGDNENNDNGSVQQQQNSPFDEGLMSKTQFAADSRTNQLLVTAPAVVHVLVEQALKTIDVEATGSMAARRDTEPYLQVYNVRSASVEEVGKTIDAIMPGIVVNEDGRSDRLHVVATAAQHREVEGLIRQLDGQGGGQTVTVIPLSKMDPLVASSMVQQMFASDGSGAPTVQPDIAGRQVMVRGTNDQIAQVKALLVQLGEDGTGQRSRGAGGPVRRFSLSGRDSERVLELIDQAWHTTQPNRIRIIPSRSRGPVRDFDNPADTEFRRNETDRPARRSQPDDDEPVSFDEREDWTQFVGLDDADDKVAENTGEPAAEQSAADAPQEPAPAADAPNGQQREVAPGVFIRVEGDELILMSEDEAALDRLEEMLEQALGAIPASNTWNVFKLQSADATEAAEMLSKLIPDANVAEASSSSSSGGFFGSLSSMGSSLASATGLNSAPVGGLQIIPEVRLNALFVSGPASKVQEVQDFLDVLDASDWPGTLRDRVPHMIPVKYAEVADVYRVVRDVYRDYLEVAPGSPGGGGNAFAMFMGGRGGRESPQQTSQEVRLTIGMDEQTSQLIVSADEGLFQQIQELVASLDNAAREAHRTVRVVELRNANTSAVQGTLGAVMPRVRVSASGSRSSSSNSSSNNTGNASSSSSSDSAGNQQGPSPDQMRQFFEQRMRDRMSGGGSDGERRSFFFGRGGGDSGDRGGDGGRSRFGRGSFGSGRGGFRGRN